MDADGKRWPTPQKAVAPSTIYDFMIIINILWLNDNSSDSSAWNHFYIQWDSQDSTGVLTENQKPNIKYSSSNETSQVLASCIN